MVDGELEEDTALISRASLTQSFPFEACPPTTKQASHSPCLQRLIDAIALTKDEMTVAECNSLIKVCHSLCVLFTQQALFLTPQAASGFRGYSHDSYRHKLFFSFFLFLDILDGALRVGVAHPINSYRYQYLHPNNKQTLICCRYRPHLPTCSLLR